MDAFSFHYCFTYFLCLCLSPAYSYRNVSEVHNEKIETARKALLERFFPDYKNAFNKASIRRNSSYCEKFDDCNACEAEEGCGYCSSSSKCMVYDLYSFTDKERCEGLINFCLPPIEIPTVAPPHYRRFHMFMIIPVTAIKATCLYCCCKRRRARQRAEMERAFQNQSMESPVASNSVIIPQMNPVETENLGAEGSTVKVVDGGIPYKKF